MCSWIDDYTNIIRTKCSNILISKLGFDYDSFLIGETISVDFYTGCTKSDGPNEGRFILSQNNHMCYYQILDDTGVSLKSYAAFLNGIKYVMTTKELF